MAAVLEYIYEKIEAELLYKNGVIGDTWQKVAKEMEIEAATSKRCKQRCYHLSLSIDPRDKNFVSDQDFIDIALKYAEILGMRDNQFVIIKHNDVEHPHVHIAFNRVKDGKAARVSHDYWKLVDLDREVEKEYGLIIAPYEDRVRLKGQYQNIYSKELEPDKILRGNERCQKRQPEEYIPSFAKGKSQERLHQQAEYIKQVEDELKEWKEREKLSRGEDRGASFVLGRAFKNPYQSKQNLFDAVRHYGADVAMEMFYKNPEQFGELSGKKTILGNNKERRQALRELESNKEEIYKLLQAVEQERYIKSQVKSLNEIFNRHKPWHQKQEYQHKRSIAREKISRWKHYNRQAATAMTQFKQRSTRNNAEFLGKALKARNGAAQDVRGDAFAYKIAKDYGVSDQIDKQLDQFELNNDGFLASATYRIFRQDVINLCQRIDQIKEKEDRVPESIWRELREVSHKRDEAAAKMLGNRDQASNFIEITKRLEKQAKQAFVEPDQRKPHFVNQEFKKDLLLSRWKDLHNKTQKVSNDVVKLPGNMSELNRELKKVKLQRDEMAAKILKDPACAEKIKEIGLLNILQFQQQAYEKETEKAKAQELGLDIGMGR